MGQSASFSTDVFTPGQLVANNPDLLFSIPGTLLAGQNLLRGALLGKITASGKYVLSLSAAVDGSQTPAGILVDDVNATAGDEAALLYIRGDFIADALTYGAAHTSATVAAALRDMGIFLFNAQGGV